MKPVLCFGDVDPDLIIPYGNALLTKEGADLSSEQLTVQVLDGGSVGNTTVGIARQGVPVMFLGTAGNDSMGRMLRDTFVREGVDVSLMRLNEGMATVLILIVVDKDGDRTTFACPKVGASQHQITSDMIPDDITERIGWMHSTGMTLRESPAAETQLKLMQRCHEAKIPVSLDINARIESLGDPLFEKNIRAALPYCSVILGSDEDEIMPLTDYDNPIEAARSLAGNGRIVVSRRGDKGARVFVGSQMYEAPAYKVKVADTVGAGDAYNAGFISAIMQGSTVEQANRLACAIASCSVTKPGGRAIPNKAELQAFLSKYTKN